MAGERALQANQDRQAAARRAEAQAERTPAQMDGPIYNAIITNAPLDEETLLVALGHYKGLEAMLRISGPLFSNARRDAAMMYNRTADRIEADRKTREAREQSQAENEIPRLGT